MKKSGLLFFSGFLFSFTASVFACPTDAGDTTVRAIYGKVVAIEASEGCTYLVMDTEDAPGLDTGHFFQVGRKHYIALATSKGELYKTMLTLGIVALTTGRPVQAQVIGRRAVASVLSLK